MNRILTVGGMALSLALAGASSASAQTDCTTLPNPVVVSGSTAVKTLVKEFAKLAATGTETMTVVYAGTGSCDGVNVMVAAAAPTVSKTGATYWDATGEHSCDIVGGAIDLVFSDVYAKSCPGVTDTSKIKDTSLLVIPFAFVVPKGSTQKSIDAREAYYLYGEGESANIAPWTKKSLIFQRDQKSGTQVTIFKNLGIDTTSTNGTDGTGTGALLSSVAMSSDAESTMGFASLDAIDAKRDLLTILAYRHFGQKLFWWPDSTSGSFDKQNVLDGHYPLWSYEHALLRKDAPSAKGEKLLKYLTGELPIPQAVTSEKPKSMERLTTENGLVPTCAMKVARSDDAGPFSVVPHTAAASCSCLFEKYVPSGATSCKVCDKPSDCSDGTTCSHGFCEKN